MRWRLQIGAVFALPASVAFLSGCYSAAELGYTNTVRPRGGGGTTAVVRMGSASIPNEDSAVGGDLALRADAATIGSRLSFGPSALFAPPTIRDDKLSSFIRPSLWVAVARWGPARQDFFLTPSLDVGMLLIEGPLEERSRRLYIAGARLEYLGRDDTLDRNFAWSVYLSYGHYDAGGSCF